MVRPKTIAARSEFVDQVLTRLQAQNPDPKCELYYETPFQLLVSVVLSAQATDKSVNAAMTGFYQAKLSLDDVLALGEAGFLAKIRQIGLAPTKARNVLGLCRRLKDNFHSQVPNTREDLESLPGVGRKTASVVLGEIFHAPTIAVDTHVFRVTQRLGLQSETTPDRAEASLLKIIKPKWLPKAHHWFILLGRYTCTARSPKCATCLLADLCPKILEV